MNKIIAKLKIGDLRTKGKSEEIVNDVLDDPKLFDCVMAGMDNDDPGVRMRASDAVEKITIKFPEYLDPYKDHLINNISKIDQQEVCWHTAQMLPRLKLTKKERFKVFQIFVNYLNDSSKIVKTFAMQGLAEIAKQDKSYLPAVMELLEKLIEEGSPAMKARGKKLIATLNIQKNQ